MLWRRDQDQLISMNEYHGQTAVVDGKGNDAEIDRVIDDRFENLGVVGALDIHRHIGILLFEVCKNVGQDVQAGAFVGADDDFAAGNALHLGNGDHHGLAGVQRLFHVLQKSLAGGGERDFAAGTVEQLGADFFLDAANLRRNRRLGAETLLRRPRERGVPRHFEKGFELVEVHWSSQFSALSYQPVHTYARARTGIAESSWLRADSFSIKSGLSVL